VIRSNHCIASRLRRPIDLAAISRQANSTLPAHLARTLPGGKIVGREYVAINPRRADRQLGSFKRLQINSAITARSAQSPVDP
jgi:hypothetical protein